MRYLLLTRGVPGSGKSYWLKSQGLEPYTISPDQIRLLFTSPVMDSSGKLGISQKMNKRVWQFVYELVEERMDRGEFIVVDATHKKAGDFQKYQELAKKYLYEIACIDFSKVPLQTCLERNWRREEYKRVPDDVLTRHHHEVTSSFVPKSILIIDPFTNTANDFESFFKKARITHFLNHFKKIHIIGDIQGCFDPIQEYFKDGFKDDEFYIFSGDLLDRGTQNGKVLRWALDNIATRDNAVMIMGNHERHLVKWASDIPAKIPDLEFDTNTLPQILHERINKSEVYNFVSQMVDTYKFIYADKNFFVSHAGVGTLPKNIERITSKQYWNAMGAYGEPIDTIFSENNSSSYIQVHGHRNTKNLAIQASNNSFNLEGKIEFGGELRIVTFEKEGDNLKITTIGIKNNTFNKDLKPKVGLT